HHGADDNASGSAGLLELARMLTKQPTKPRRTIVFIAFSGEEEGLLGSDYYVSHPLLPLQNTAAMINMDMIGRLQDSKLIIGGVGTAPEWRAMIQTENSPDHMRAAAADMFPARRDEDIRYKVDPKGTGGSSGYPLIIGANGLPVV